ncbi:MAG: S1 RNA-binding domain-containing protein [Treponema sp.]|jgi:small subunit ribosomal protein S1|nr:S1 RNA-binding domain-containing protein [Treponema sp.]
MNELLKILLFFGISLGMVIFIVFIYILGKIYPTLRIIISDIVRFFGWTGKKVRKFSIEQRYQGSINGIIQEYNKNFENPILPHCKIEWVTPENQQNILKENEAIICLSFNKKDDNLNFYNATLNFVQTALIAKAKDYLNKSYSKAIDLLTTHIILRKNRREVLTIFRKKLNDFDENIRHEFENLIPTDNGGLFFNMLLPEFHFYGELIDTLPPNSEFNAEADGLFNWFKELATRETDERTNLKYISKNIKIGVILVGRDETWGTQGITAYTKWADYYATNDFTSVYVLARKKRGEDRADELVKILNQVKGFDIINKNPKIRGVTAEGKEYIVTCYSLRPNKTNIIYLAWEELKKCYDERIAVSAIIDYVQKSSIFINIFGLKYELPNAELSEITINDAQKVFKIEDELFLNIIEFDADRQHIVLSNKGTNSDPKHYINAILDENKVYSCIVEKIQTDQQGLQKGLLVSNDELKNYAFIPKSKVTYSRFLDLNKKYTLKQNINIIIEKYDSSSSRFIGKLNNIINPWESKTFSNLKIGNSIKVLVKQINEFVIICEIEEGLECFLSKQEISWDKNESVTSLFKVDDEIEVRIMSIDLDKNKINVSIKRLAKTIELEYFESYFNKLVDVEVTELISGKGLAIKYPNGTNTGFIHWFEIGWGPVGRFETLYNKGDILKAVLYEFDTEKNSLKFSIKRQFNHQFTEWLNNIDKKEVMQGKVIRHFENSAQIEITKNNFTVQAFILKQDISNFAYIETKDLQFYLPIGHSFGFYIKEINESWRTISLSRREYLNQSEYPQYGVTINTTYVKESNFKGYLYSDEIEGWTNLPSNKTPLGKNIEVLLISSKTGEFAIVDKTMH